MLFFRLLVGDVKKEKEEEKNYLKVFSAVFFDILPAITETSSYLSPDFGLICL